MISWHIKVNNNKYPEKFNPATDSCWFPDFSYQELLLPYFGTGKVEIDEYGRTEFVGEELERLWLRLQHYYDSFEARGKRWTVKRIGHSRPIDKEEDMSFIEEFIFERDVILDLFDTTMKMIEEAERLSGTLVFLGD